MSLFGMGSMELVVILVIALIVFGPEKLAELAGQGGRALRDFRRMTREVTGEFEESIAPMRGVMDEMKSTVTDMQRETRDLADSVTDITNSAAADVRAGAGVVKEEAASLSSAAAGRTTSTPGTPAAQRRTAPAAVPTKEDPLADLDGLDDE